ncbi:MAG: DinB family protein [Bacteroidetes bacterium]|nr:DinB family protein [Bacteroidota bacterium]
MTEMDRITRLLEKTFDQQPWYGSSIMEILKTVNPLMVNQRSGDTHTIAELVEHMISWRTFTTKRLQGDAEFQVNDTANFPVSPSWEDTIKRLHQSQEELVKAAKLFPEERLNELVPSNQFRYTFYTLLHGIIQHDVYHLGQIALLKKVIELNTK